jgi:hypothetical protein
MATRDITEVDRLNPSAAHQDTLTQCAITFNLDSGGLRDGSVKLNAPRSQIMF